MEGVTRVGSSNVARIAETVDAICESPRVVGYLIGYTANNGQRIKAYKAEGFPHYVVLAEGLNRNDALQLERALQERIRDKPQENCYRKYHEAKRDGPYRPSSGGVSVGADELVHSVYMAWWE